MLRCWYYDVSELEDPALFDRGMEQLPWPERRERVLRYRRDADRRLSLGAGLLCAYALCQAGAGTDFRMTIGESGKPALADRPDLHFNLSHSGTLAVCAVSDRPVGADTEQIRPVSQDIAKRFFLPEECAWLEKVPEARRDRAFLKLWTRKESSLKLLGTGLTQSLNSFSVLQEDRERHFSETEVSGHLICVCSPSQEDAEFLRWDGIS